MRDMNKAVWALSVAVFLGASGGVLAQQSGEQVYKTVCAVCHASGVDKAPRFGDRKDWGARIREGQVVLTAQGLVGQGKMPARGGKRSRSRPAAPRSAPPEGRRR